MKILLTCIVKGDSEIDEFERMLSSFMPYCDGLVASLTGIDEKFDKTIKLIKKYHGKYLITNPTTHPNIYSKDEKGYFFSNFAEARNTTFELANSMLTIEPYTWYTWADVDDILIGGEQMRMVAEKVAKTEIDDVFFTYWYSVLPNEKGEYTEDGVEIDHLRERLIRPQRFKWVSRLHEVAVPKDGNYKPKSTMYDYNSKEKRTCAWVHIVTKEQAEINLKRNLRILELQVREEKRQDPRTIFYLAKTYYDLKDPQKDKLALLLLDEYREKSGWAEERGNSWEYTGNLYARFGDHYKAIDAYFNGLKEFPQRHMLYLYLAKEYAEVKRFDESDFWLDVVGKLPPPTSRTTIGNPLEVKFMFASLMYNRMMRKMNLPEALTYLKARNKIGKLKDDGMIKTLEELIEMNEAAKNVVLYANWLKKTKNEDKIEHLLKALPYELGKEQFAFQIANQVAKPKIWPKKSIVYYASWGGSHFEGWSPKNVDSQGIGGSERAVIELSKRWAKKGYKVVVYGDPREMEGEYEGVEYRAWYEINWNDTFDTLILWRSPHLLDLPLKANKIFMDLHDVASNLDWTPEREAKVDKVFFKSKYHRDMVPNIADDKAVIISNGISI